MIKARELHEMEDDAVLEQIRNLRRELFGLRFKHATGELENTAGLRNTKRDLARAMTVARQRELKVD